MSLDLGYSYCTNLTEQEKLDIDKQVRKNQLELRFAIFFPFFPVPIFPMPMTPFFPVEGFGPQQIIRNGRDRVESAIAKKMAPMAQFVDDCEAEYNEYKVYSEISSTLSKISKKVREDKETKKGLDNLHEQLKNGELHGGRGAKKLAGSKTIFYLRSGGEARLFFRYSEKEEEAVEVVAESDKDREKMVIKNLKKNYK